MYFYTNTELGTKMLKCLLELLPASSCMQYSDYTLRTCPLGYDGSQADIEIMGLMLLVAYNTILQHKKLKLSSLQA